MSPDTLAAVRLLALALATHPEDVASLQAYGHLPAHLADVVTDWIETDDSEAGE